MQHRVILLALALAACTGGRRPPTVGGNTSTTTPAWCNGSDRYAVFGGGKSFSIVSNQRYLFIAARDLECPDLTRSFLADLDACGQIGCELAGPFDERMRKALDDIRAVEGAAFANVAGCDVVTHYQGQSFEAIGLCPNAARQSFLPEQGEQSSARLRRVHRRTVPPGDVQRRGGCTASDPSESPTDVRLPDGRSSLRLRRDR